MNGLDPIIATTLATRIDSVLNAVSGSAGSAAQTSGTQEAAPATNPVPGAGSGAPAAGQANSAETTLSNTALALDAILRLDTSLLSNAGVQQQATTLLATPPSQASSLSANLAADANAASAQSADSSAEDVANLATLLGSGTTTGAATPGATTTSPNPAGTTTAAASLANLTGVNSGDPLVNALATALQQAVGNSGLFYESHLAQWLSGTRSSDSLQNEPQAQLNTPSQAAGGQMLDASGLSNKLSATLATLLNPGNTQASTTQAGGTLTTTAASAMLAGAKTGPEQNNLPIHPDSVALVRQQLDLLSTSQFQWSGHAWPGAPMDWEISRRDGQSSNGSNEPADGQIWHTRISLELPGLGKVEAQLSLNAKQLTARISANAQSAATMANNSVDLRRRAAAAGLDLLSLQIRQSGTDLDADEDDEAATQPVTSSAGEV